MKKISLLAPCAIANSLVLPTAAQASAQTFSCGASSNSANWIPAPSDIDRLEETLPPLLPQDLKSSGSSAVAYAADESSWRRTAVQVSDGAEFYWRAIYIQKTGQFIKYQGATFGGIHVAFHSRA